MLPYLLVAIASLAYFLFTPLSRRKSPFLLALFLMSLALFVGLGDMIGGYDRYIYSSAYDYIADEIRAGSNYRSMLFLINGSEYGYFWWEMLVAQFTANRYIFILLTTLAIYVLFFLAIKEYLEDYPLACLLFLGLLYYFTMTYLRQVIAVGIAWQGVKFIWQRKPFQFFAIILLAFSFHNSVLIFAPMYFVPQKKYSKRSVLRFLAVCLLLGLTPLPNILIASSGGVTGMSDRTASYVEQYQGFRIEYVIEVIVFVWLLFQNYRWIDHTPKQLVFLNMSFAFCALLMIFMRFGQGGRFSWYYMLGLIYMLTTLSNRKGAFVWMKPIIVTLSLSLFMRITISWQSMNAPYKTFLTNGEPAGDGSIYRQYEYDTMYTEDKLYR